MNNKPRKKYHKLTDIEKKEIITLYKLDNSKKNIAKIAKEYDITERQVFNLLKKNVSNEIEKGIKHNIKNQEDDFTKRIGELIKITMDRLEKELLSNDNKVTISQLSTTLGILYDKSRLEQNLSTSNNAININIKVEK